MKLAAASSEAAIDGATAAGDEQLTVETDEELAFGEGLGDLGEEAGV